MATPQPAPSVTDRLLVIETNLSNLTDRVGRLETHMDARFNAIENRLTLILVSTLAAVIAGFGGLIAAVFFR
jgi:hypothetical protein